MIHLAKSISMKAEDKAQSLQEDNYATGSEGSGDMPRFHSSTQHLWDQHRWDGAGGVARAGLGGRHRSADI